MSLDLTKFMLEVYRIRQGRDKADIIYSYEKERNSMTKKKTLGRIKKTERGFELIEFTDHNGNHCSLQQSSAAICEQPGAGAVWLGPDSEEVGSRMHLDYKQVPALIAHLQAWLVDGSFKL